MEPMEAARHPAARANKINASGSLASHRFSVNKGVPVFRCQGLLVVIPSGARNLKFLRLANFGNSKNLRFLPLVGMTETFRVTIKRPCSRVSVRTGGHLPDQSEGQPSWLFYPWRLSPLSRCMGASTRDAPGGGDQVDDGISQICPIHPGGSERLQGAGTMGIECENCYNFRHSAVHHPRREGKSNMRGGYCYGKGL